MPLIKRRRAPSQSRPFSARVFHKRQPEDAAGNLPRPRSFGDVAPEDEHGCVQPAQPVKPSRRFSLEHISRKLSAGSADDAHLKQSSASSSSIPHTGRNKLVHFEGLSRRLSATFGKDSNPSETNPSQPTATSNNNSSSTTPRGGNTRPSSTRISLDESLRRALDFGAQLASNRRNSLSDSKSVDEEEHHTLEENTHATDWTAAVASAAFPPEGWRETSTLEHLREVQEGQTKAIDLLGSPLSAEGGSFSSDWTATAEQPLLEEYSTSSEQRVAATQDASGDTPELAEWLILKHGAIRKSLFVSLHQGRLSAGPRQSAVPPHQLVPPLAWSVDLQGASVRMAFEELSLSLRPAGGQPETVMCFLNERQMSAWMVALDRAAHPDDFPRFYHTSQFIARGTYSSVQIARHSSSSKQYAVRLISAQLLQTPTAAALAPLRQIRHPCLISVLDVFCDSSMAYIVTDLASNRFTLENVLEREGALDENSTRAIFRDLIRALAHLHSHGLVHRAVCPRNVFCVPEDEEGGETSPHNVEECFDASVVAKLSEPPVIGLVNEETAANIYRNRIREEPQFTSPEELHKVDFGQSTDIWAAGVLLYLCLCGQFPFGSAKASMAVVLQEIEVSRVHLDRATRNWRKVSPLAVELVQTILVKDPGDRPSAEAILAHPWLAR